MKALIIVDVQNDFVPGGALPVAEGDRIVPIVNALQSQFELVVATQDWHPANHESFAANHPGRKPGDVIDLHGLQQILWPVHCVQGSRGAEFVPKLETSRFAEVFRKGIDPDIDSYSGFFDNGHRRSTGLDNYLKQKRVTEIYIGGLTTDYCVRFTALDGQTLGFKTHVVEDACRGVELQAGDVGHAIEEMRRAGVKLIRSTDLLTPM
jgi:nicotinamidase/pyrazinamidase